VLNTSDRQPDQEENFFQFAGFTLLACVKFHAAKIPQGSLFLTRIFVVQRLAWPLLKCLKRRD